MIIFCSRFIQRKFSGKFWENIVGNIKILNVNNRNKFKYYRILLDWKCSRRVAKAAHVIWMERPRILQIWDLEVFRKLLERYINILETGDNQMKSLEVAYQTSKF